MRFTQHGVWSSALFCTCAVLAVSAFGQTDDAMVVVLKNTSVMQGRVTQSARGLRLEMTSGGTLELAFDQVLCLATSMDDAYEQLSRQGDLGDDTFLQSMFAWCVRYEQWTRAEQLMLVADQRLPAATAQSMWQQLAAAVERANNRNAANATQSNPTAAHDVPDESAIQDLMANLPVDAEKIFNQQVQSKLLLGCAAARCHDRSHSGLSFWHDGLGRSQPRGYGRRNIYELMQWVDRAQPVHSRLLQMAREPHGGLEQAASAAGSETDRWIEYWIYLASGKEDVYWATVQAQQTMNDPQPQAVQANAATDSPQVKFDADVQPTGFVTPPPTVPSHDHLIGADEEQPQPIMPCDPAPFNRRFHPQKSGR